MDEKVGGAGGGDDLSLQSNPLTLVNPLHLSRVREIGGSLRGSRVGLRGWACLRSMAQASMVPQASMVQAAAPLPLIGMAIWVRGRVRV